MQFLTAKTSLGFMTIIVVSMCIGSARFDKLLKDSPETLPKTPPTLDSADSSDSFTTPKPPQFGRPDQQGEWESFSAMHDFFTQSFVESTGFGMERIINIDQPSQRGLRIDDLVYYHSKINLIGLKTDTPVVYESSWLNPVKTKLEIYQTRNLTALETEALEKMKAGEDLVWNISPDQTEGTLIGALRAQQSCIECHQVNEGHLLGAFVYSLYQMELPQKTKTSAGAGLVTAQTSHLQDVSLPNP